MKKYMGRLVSLLLSVCLTVSLLPAQVSAAESGDSQYTVESGILSVSDPVIVTTFAELKTELEKTAAEIIQVNADIEMNSAITVNADHTLIVNTDKTLSFLFASPGKLTIPAGITLTLSGPGTFRCNNYNNITVDVMGTLSLTNQLNLIVENSGTNNSYGIWIDSNAILQSTDSNIDVKNNDIMGVALFGEMTVRGGSLTVANTGSSSIGIYATGSLNVLGGCNLRIANPALGSSGIFGNLLVQDSSAEIADVGTYMVNGSSLGIYYTQLTLDNSTITVHDINAGNSGIHAYSNSTLTLKNNARLWLQSSDGANFISDSSATLFIDDSELLVDSGASFDCPNVLTGANSGKIQLTEGAKTGYLSGKLKDRGIVFNIPGSYATVTSSNNSPSETALTAGTYIWNGSTYFEKNFYSYLTIKNGSQSGSYKVNDTVTIMADPAPDGMEFSGWSCDRDISVADVNSATTTCIVPAYDVTLTANYKASSIAVTKITLNKTGATPKTGETISLKAAVTPANATNPSVTWKTSNKTVATVNSSGTVTAKGVGSAVITVTSKSNPSVSASCKVTVSVGKTTGLKASGNKTTSLKLTWKKQNNVSGYVIYRYSTKQKTYSKIATVKKDSTVSYTDTKRSPATVYQYKVKAYTKTNGKTVYGAYSSVLKTATAAKAPVLGGTAGSKKAALTWKKTAGSSGYEIYMSTKKSAGYTRQKTAGAKTTTYTKTGLTRGKTYYFKIRTYQNVNGVKIYSSYSNIQKLKVK